MAKYKIDGISYNIDEEMYNSVEQINEIVDEIRRDPGHWQAVDKKHNKETFLNDMKAAVPFMYEDKRTEGQAIDDAMKMSTFDRARQGIGGTIETGAQMITGLAGMVPGGLRMVTDLALGSGLEGAIEAGRETADRFTYTPRSTMGRVISDMAGHGFEAARAGVGQFAENVAAPSQTEQYGDSPLARTLGEAAFDILTMVGPVAKGGYNLRAKRIAAEKQAQADKLAELKAAKDAKQLKEHQAQVLADQDNAARGINDRNLMGDFPAERPEFNTPPRGVIDKPHTGQEMLREPVAYPDSGFEKSQTLADRGGPPANVDPLSLEQRLRQNEGPIEVNQPGFQEGPTGAGLTIEPQRGLGRPPKLTDRRSLEERLNDEMKRIEQETGTIGAEPFSDPNAIPFPLRQEVLNDPTFRLQLDTYQRNIAAHEAAGRTAEAESLRAKFGELMRRHGVETPQDATGLNRPFWEPESKSLPVQKTGTPKLGASGRGGPKTPFQKQKGWLDESRLGPIDAPRNLMSDTPAMSRRNRAVKEIAEQGPDVDPYTGQIIDLGIGIDYNAWVKKYGKQITDRINKAIDPEWGMGGGFDTEKIVKGERGMVRYIKPSEFLKLARPLPRNLKPEDRATLRVQEQAILDGDTVGNPYLYAVWDQQRQRWVINAHDGRHRAMVLQKMFNDTPIPVVFDTYAPSKHMQRSLQDPPPTGAQTMSTGDFMDSRIPAELIQDKHRQASAIGENEANVRGPATVEGGVDPYAADTGMPSGVGTKQGGAIDFNIFKETYADFKRKLEKDHGPQPDDIVKAMWEERNNPKPVELSTADKQRNAALADIPGIRAALEDLLVDTSPLVLGKEGGKTVFNPEMKAKLDQVVDISNHALEAGSLEIPFGKGFRQLISGAANTARLYKNAAIKLYADYVNEAYTKVETDGSKLLLSKEHGVTEAVNHLTKKEQIQMWKDVILPNEGKRDLSLADLHEMGLSKNQIDFYMKARAALQYVFEEVNKIREQQGLEPIERRKGYFPAKFVGDFFIQVWADAEKKNLIGLYSANNKAHIKRVMEHIERDHGADTPDNWQVSEIQERNPWARRKESASVWNVMGDMQKTLAEGDPRAAVLAELLEKYENDQMRYYKGFHQHLKNPRGAGGKEKIPGSAGRDPLLSDHQNAQKAFRALHDYIQQSLEYVEFNRISPSVNALLNPKHFDKIPNAQEYMRMHWDRARGIPSKAAQVQYDIVSSIAHMLGYSGGAAKSGLAMLKPQVLLMMLGYNTPRFLIAQFLQPNQFLMQQTMALKARGLDIGYTDQINAWGKGIYHAYQLAKGREFMESHAKKALEWAENNNVVDPHMFEDIKTDIERRASGAWSYINGEKSIRWTEKKARLQAFLTFAELFNKEGLSFKEQMDLSAKMTRMTMVDYRPFEKPLAYQNLGLIGDMISPLQTFKHNYYTQMAIGVNEFMKANWKDKPQYAAPIILGLAMQQLFSGLMGLPGREDADTILGWAKKLWPKFPDATQVILQSDWGLDKDNDIGRNYITHGISTITGLDMSPTFSAAQIVPDATFKDIAPILSKGWDIGSSAYGWATRGTDEAKWDFIKQTTPNAYQWAVERMMQQPGGQIPNPSRGMVADVKRSTDPMDKAWIARYLGTRTIEESREKTANFEFKKEQGSIRERKELLLDRAYEDWKAGKTMTKHLQELATYGMTIDEVLRTMKAKDKERILTEKQRQYGGIPKSRQQMEKYKDMQRYK